MKLQMVLPMLSLMACGGAQSVNETTAPPHDRQPPNITEWMAQPAILVFSKTLGWRHNEGIAGADLFFVQLARQYGFGVFTTANGAVFNERDLARFQIVIFNNMTGDTLSAEQERAFQTWLEKGGGWIGLHSAGDASHDDWPWYQQRLIGPRFIGHPAKPQFQEARIVTLAPAHPVMQGLPAEWRHREEWYSFDGRPQEYGFTPLVGLDEKTYRPYNDVYGSIADLRMGEGAINHPIIWAHCPQKGRAVYSAIGHSDENFDDQVYRQLLENSFLWVSGKTDPAGKACKASQ